MTPQTLLTHALELMQLVLLAIVFFGLYVLGAGERRMSLTQRRARPARRLRDAFAWFLLLSLAILVSTHDMLPLRGMLPDNVPLPDIAQSVAFPLVFALDLLGAALLIALTGGYARSPFAPVLLLLPAFAILLRETPLRVLGYALAAAVLSALLLRRPEIEMEPNPWHRQASTVVATGCLGLCALLGYVTRLLL